jgi:hypothetical protein
MTINPGHFLSGPNIPSKDVSEFHNNSDLDSGQLAQHHTLGKASNQAAPGNHHHLDSRNTDWITFPFSADWQPNGGASQAPQYRYWEGWIELRGWPQYIGVASSSVPGILPAGFRSAALEDFTVWTNAGTNIRCRTEASGILTLSTALSTNQAFCFGTMRFRQGN